MKRNIFLIFAYIMHIVFFTMCKPSSQQTPNEHLFTSDTIKTKQTIIYFGDPMCSWCYGLSPELKKLRDTLGDSVHWKLVNGGLRPFNDQTMEDLQPFLDEHWAEVSERSGQPFTHTILRDHTFVYDTEPSCRAVITVNQLKPGFEFDYFAKIQKAFYIKNKHINKGQVLAELAVEYGINQDEFLDYFTSDEAKDATKQQFAYSNKMGVTGFPSMMIEIEGTYHWLLNGHSTADEMLKRISALQLQHD